MTQPGGRGGGGGGAALAPAAPSAKRPPPPLEPDDTLHASDSEADDVAAALATATRTDAALEADLAAAEAAAAPPRRAVGGDGGSDTDDSDAGPTHRGGALSFVDETRALKPATKRARRDGGAATAAAPQPHAAAPAQPRRGELVRAGLAPAVGGGGPNGSSFAGLGLDPSLAAHLAAQGFASPTRVQASTIPALLSRRDALVRAPTGSGKTLAYAAPIMQCLAGWEGGEGRGVARAPRVPRSAGARAIIILPTRELALQVADVLATLARRYHWVVPGVLYGGESRTSEKARLRRGVAALAATPGRLLDHLQNTAALRVASLEWLVLDEADRLLDLGMEAKVGAVLGELTRLGARVGGGGGDDAAAAAAAPPPHRVATVLLSATMSSSVTGLGGVTLVNPVRVGDVGEEKKEGGTTDATAPPSAATGADVAPTVTHAALVVPARARLAAAAALMLRHASAGRRVLVFCSSCDGVEGAHALLTRGVSAARERGRAPLDDGDTAPPGLLPSPALLLKLHGNMPQAERSAAFLAFSRAAGGAALVATDVAARGLDFPSLAAVVHADAPASVADYCHRAGRAGRAGEKGESVLILTPSEAEFCGVLASAGVPPPLPRRRAVRSSPVGHSRPGRRPPAPPPTHPQVCGRVPRGARPGGGAAGGHRARWRSACRRGGRLSRRGACLRHLPRLPQTLLPHQEDAPGPRGARVGVERRAQRVWGEKEVICVLCFVVVPAFLITHTRPPPLLSLTPAVAWASAGGAGTGPPL